MHACAWVCACTCAWVCACTCACMCACVRVRLCMHMRARACGVNEHKTWAIGARVRERALGMWFTCLWEKGMQRAFAVASGIQKIQSACSFPACVRVHVCMPAACMCARVQVCVSNLTLSYLFVRERHAACVCRREWY